MKGNLIRAGLSRFSSIDMSAPPPLILPRWLGAPLCLLPPETQGRHAILLFLTASVVVTTLASTK
jgi:hypothetical protein